LGGMGADVDEGSTVGPSSVQRPGILSHTPQELQGRTWASATRTTEQGTGSVRSTREAAKSQFPPLRGLHEAMKTGADDMADSMKKGLTV